MLELPLIKRKALFKGETGLFAATQDADEEVKRLANDGETLWAEIHSPENAKLLRLLWAVATKLAQGGLFEDKDSAMDYLKMRAGREKVRLSRQDRAALSKLADIFIFIVCSELLPQMTESQFRSELEDIIA